MNDMKSLLTEIDELREENRILTNECMQKGEVINELKKEKARLHAEIKNLKSELKK